MQRFKNILLYHDVETRSKASLGRAVELAGRNQARLTIVDVLEESQDFPEMTFTSPPLPDLRDLVKQKKRNRLEKLVASIQEEGVSAKAKLLFGTPFIEIIREVVRNKHDLVIKKAEGAGGLTEMLFGSTAMHLMRKCPCPVWIMKPTRSKRYSRILAAVDPQPGNQERESLNVKIMDLATSLAQLEQSQLHVLHVRSLYRDYTRGSVQSSTPANLLDDLIDDTRKIHQRRLDELLGKYDLKNIKHQIHLPTGDPEKLIPEVAQKKRINLLVMGTVCRTGVSGLLIGNTAEKVLHQVNCSVLTVKPDGFVTPVKLED